MSETEVKKVYETLSGVETKLNKQEAYPIHKRLNFGVNSELQDAYDWIAKHIELPNSGNILDAGCGVGYGSFYLCERSNCNSLGISLSEREVAFAKAIARNKGMEARCQFAVQSYDEKLIEKYDLIIGVESIKHSMQLDQTLENLIGALAPGGKLLILEDLFLEESANRHTRQLCKDWHLKKAFTLADYKKTIDQYPELNLQIHDLTPYVIHKNSLRLTFQYVTSGVFGNLFSLFKKGDLLQIMRGGYALEKLYLEQQVKYQILELSK